MKKFGLLVVLVAFGLAFAGCEKAKVALPGDEEKQATTEPETPGSVNVANVQINTAGGKTITLPVEIAATDQEREKGLKGRDEPPFKTGGMWFVFPADVKDAFWMQETTIPLDMIFVDADKKIVDIKANTTPNSEEKLFPMKDSQVIPYRYVLEVGKGFAADNGLAIGDTVTLKMGP